METIQLINVKIKRILSQSNNFCIFVGVCEGANLTFVSSLNKQFTVGEKLNITGINKTHPIYGEQIKIKSFELSNDLDKDDLLDYFKTFKGIGDAKAKKIIESFEDPIKTIKEDYLSLLSIGIKESIAYNIFVYIKENEEVANLVKLLDKNKISFTCISKIYNEYKENSSYILKKNPYILYDFNVSVDIIESFAKSIDFFHASTHRISFFIKKTLLDLALSGHTFYYLNELLSQVVCSANKYYQNNAYYITEIEVFKVVLFLKDKTKDIIVKEDGTCYLSYYYYAERNISRKITRMLKNRIEYELDIEDIISEIEKKDNIQYSENQKKAIEISTKNQITIITGGPGTGKTTVSNGVIKAFKSINNDLNICLAAPTGKAAKRMSEATGLQATTIHRLLEYKPTSEGLICGRNETNPIDADIILLDETSMVDVLLMDKFLKAIKDETLLIMVGDIDQLPSVSAGNVLKDFISSGIISVIKLDTIYRQKGNSPIVTNAKLINEGKYIEISNNFDFISIQNEKEVAQKIIDKFIDFIEGGKTLDEVQVLCPMKNPKNYCSSTNLNKMIQAKINPKKNNFKDLIVNGVIYRVGDKVIQLKNNYKKECFNGEMGYISEVDVKKATLCVKFDDREIVFSGFEEIKELDLAYAMTIHKSQGSECPIILIPMVLSQQKMLFRNLLYTGITRGKDQVILFGHKDAISKSIKTIDSTKRYTRLSIYLKDTIINFKK